MARQRRRKTAEPESLPDFLSVGSDSGAPAPAEPPASQPPAESFDFATDTSSGSSPSTGSTRVYRRRRTPWWRSPTLLIFVLLAAAGGGLWWWNGNREQPVATATLTVVDIAAQVIEEGQPLSFRVGLKAKGVRPDSIRFSLIEPPPGATIDPVSGQFSWTPGEDQGPGEFEVRIRAAAASVENTNIVRITVAEVDLAPIFEDVEQVTAKPGQTVTLQLKATDPDVPASSIGYRLVDGPEDAGISPTGMLTWKVPADVAGEFQRIQVEATEGASGQSALCLVSIRLEYMAPTADALATALRKAGAEVTARPAEKFSSFTGEPQQLTVNGEQVLSLFYQSPLSLESESTRVTKDASQLFGQPGEWKAKPHLFRNDYSLVIYEGENAEVLSLLRTHMGEPFAVGQAPSATPARKLDDSEVSLLTLLKRDRLKTADAYRLLREMYASRFKQQFEPAMKTAWGEDYEEMAAWLQDHEEIRQELFTAIQPEHDNVPAVLTLFNQLRKEFPQQIEKYAHLAIATSVVWDGERGGVYDYEHHQRRTHSNLPDDMLGAIDNFRYFLSTENAMQGRAQFLPWEFLVFLIDHRTPLAERQWALGGFGNRRIMFGRCYQDVPYDVEMLETSSAVCKLDGQDYTLPNILSFGGVCAMQADFAARVGKSIGVPAAYVGGESRSGDLHAWVMWVELQDVKPGRIRFSLESHGRYRGDRYYVGTLRDPQTGQRITDRQLERRLQASGVNAVARRHADLLMRAWPFLRDQGKLNVTRQLQLLWDVISISPGNAEPWIELAGISSSQELDRDQRRMMVRSLDKLFQTFAGFPDFTWTVFDDLIRYEKELKVRIQLYERLIGMYDAAARPDLASTARLKLAGYQVEDGKPEAAISGLAATILRYVDEGRYVPLLLDRLEAIHREQQGKDTEIVAFYQQFLPRIPRKRGDRPSKYCQQMYRRAIALFDKAGRNDLAAALRVELQKLEASTAK